MPFNSFGEREEMTRFFNKAVSSVSDAGVVTWRVPPAGQGWVDVRSYGAKGDGVTDDTASIQAAITSVGAAGVVSLMPGAVHLTSDILVLSGHVTLEGCGATVKNVTTASATNKAIYCQAASEGTNYTFVAGAKYDLAVTLAAPAEAANFAAGDVVFLQWGVNPYDGDTWYGCDVNIVRSSSAISGVVGLEYPLPSDFASDTAPVMRVLTRPFTGAVRDLTIQMAAGTDIGVSAWRTLGARFDNLTFSDVGEYGLMVWQSRTTTASGLTCRHRNRASAGDGALINAVGAIDLKVLGCADLGVDVRPALLLEVQNRGVLIDGCTFASGQGASALYPINVVGQSEDVLVTHCRFENFNQGGRVAEASTVQWRDNNWVGLADANYLFGGGVSADSLSGNTVNGVADTTRESATLTLTDVAANQTFTAGDACVWTAPKAAVVVAHRVRLVGTKAAGTLTSYPMCGAHATFKAISISNGSATAWYDLGNTDWGLLTLAAGDGLSLTYSSSAGLNPSGSLDVVLELLVQY